MNEEELNKYIKEKFEEIHIKVLNKQYVTAGTLIRFRDACIEIGKLEQKKEDNIRFMYSLDDLTYIITNWGVKNDFPLLDEIFSKIGELKEQLQKEIGGMK